MPNSKAQTKVVNRSSVNGRFVTEKFAQSHKRETERQHVQIPAPAKKSR